MRYGQAPMHGRTAEPSETPARLIGLTAPSGSPRSPDPRPLAPRRAKPRPPRGFVFRRHAGDIL
jgi:hypothetical protein